MAELEYIEPTDVHGIIPKNGGIGVEIPNAHKSGVRDMRLVVDGVEDDYVVVTWYHQEKPEIDNVEWITNDRLREMKVEGADV